VKSTRWVITYIVMASVGLWMAFFMSLKFMAPGHAQTPPPPPPAAGDLPPEFIQETQPPGPGGENKIPPPPTQPPQVPPDHAEAAPPPPPPNVPPAAGAMPPTAPPTMPSAGGVVPPVETASPVMPQFASDDQYTYDPTGRRDPFKPYRTYRPLPTGSAKIIDTSDPLQRWDLDRFNVVAIMWEIRQPKAMVKDPDGKMYMIGKSTKIGRNSGQVVAIREGEVVVVETIENEGVQTKEVKILELKK
jgi:type IV pilus assembly protein PilP